MINRAQRRISHLPHEVYKVHDGFGSLLYVGCTINVFKRLHEHKQYARWYPEAASIEVKRYENRVGALAEEARCIVEDDPEFNVTRERQKPRHLTTKTLARFILVPEGGRWWVEGEEIA